MSHSPDEQRPQEVKSVAIASDLPMAVVVFLNFEPTSAQLRSMCDHLKGWAP